MGSATQYLSTETHINLHFQRMKQLNNIKPVVQETQDVRLGFIQYCLEHSKDLTTASIALNNYMAQNKATSPILETPEVPLTPEDMNRKKLALIFSHLATCNYTMGGLIIEPVAVGDLVKKIHDINSLSDKEVEDYLDKLIGKKIPGHADMSIESFLENMHTLYKNEGVRFHCYLRENFFNSLEANAIKEAGPSLNYFMPEIFCQRHINTCDLTTAMTILKTVVTNFNQMQAICLEGNTNIPIEVSNAQQKINKLEQKFEHYLDNPTLFNEEDIKQLTCDYQKEIRIIQVEMEKTFGKKFDPTIQPYLKKYENHALSTIHHVVTTRVMPDAFEVNNEKFQTLFQNHCSSFQEKLLPKHLEIILEKDVSRNLHKDNAAPEEKLGLMDHLKQMFLYGKARAFTDFIICGHYLVMDICKTGALKILEHRNDKKEVTTLSPNGLSNLGISSIYGKNQNPVSEALDSIAQKLKTLSMERDNLIIIQSGLKNDTEMHGEISSMLEKKEHEISDLIIVEKNLKIKHPSEEMKTSKGAFHRIRDEFRKFKEELFCSKSDKQEHEASEKNRSELN